MCGWGQGGGRGVGCRVEVIEGKEARDGRAPLIIPASPHFPSPSCPTHVRRQQAQGRLLQAATFCTEAALQEGQSAGPAAATAGVAVGVEEEAEAGCSQIGCTDCSPPRSPSPSLVPRGAPRPRPRAQHGRRPPAWEWAGRWARGGERERERAGRGSDEEKRVGVALCVPRPGPATRPDPPLRVPAAQSPGVGAALSDSPLGVESRRGEGVSWASGDAPSFSWARTTANAPLNTLLLPLSPSTRRVARTAGPAGTRDRAEMCACACEDVRRVPRGQIPPLT